MKLKLSEVEVEVDVEVEVVEVCPSIEIDLAHKLINLET